MKGVFVIHVAAYLHSKIKKVMKKVMDTVTEK
jgi:hypothetical protein